MQCNSKLNYGILSNNKLKCYIDKTLLFIEICWIINKNIGEVVNVRHILRKTQTNVI